VDLVHDLLDKNVVDRNGREMGRVDSIVLEVRDGASPRVAAIEIGPAVLAQRIHPTLGRWVAALEHAFGVDEGRPVRIPFGAILDIQDHVKVDLAFGETAAATVEQRLRRWVASLPRSS
jgi:sporulation protein YlmC with PRC-barrel domain